MGRRHEQERPQEKGTHNGETVEQVVGEGGAAGEGTCQGEKAEQGGGDVEVADAAFGATQLGGDVGVVFADRGGCGVRKGVGGRSQVHRHSLDSSFVGNSSGAWNRTPYYSPVPHQFSTRIV